VCTDISAHNAARTDGKPWSELSVDHLQLAPLITKAIRSRGIQTLGDACVTAEGAFAEVAPYAPELIEAVRHLRAAASGSGIEWRRYWKLRGWRFHQLAATLPEFDRLEAELGTEPVTRQTLGNAGGMLQASGISTFGALISGLRSGIGSVRGLGPAKLEALFHGLLGLADDVAAGRWPPEGGVGKISGKPELPILCAEVRALPVSVLQLGSKSQWLHDAGYETVGDVADADLRSVGGLRAVGTRTVKTIRQRLEEFSMASVNGAIDWQRFSEASGLPLLPVAPVLSGRQLLDVLPEVLGTIGSHLRDDGYRDILVNRLTRGPQDQATLEAIGLRSDPVVSRERIRQKEKKLLSQLTGALIWDRDGRLGIQFHPTFTAWWRKAAAEFGGVDEIGFDEFVGRLASTWEVPVAALTTHLPFITAVVTGEPRMPAALRAGASLDPRFFRLQPSAAAIPLLRFRLGKVAQRLTAQGIATLGDLLRAVSAGSLSQNLDTGLEAIASGIGPDGLLNWEAYAAATGLVPLPSVPSANAPAFLAGFTETVCSLLTRVRRSERTARIFALRTQHPVRTRMTLDAVASAIGTYPSHVKNEETALLEQLHDIIVEREFAEVPVWVDQTWLDRCREAHLAFEMCRPDYVRFLGSLALRWGVSHTEAESAAPGLWAIFTGYPAGRSRGARPLPDEAPLAPELSTARIKLRGFRRIH
jgi:hypothetical protein